MPGIANNWPPWRTIVIFSWTAFEETDWRRVLGLSSLEMGWDILMDFLRFRAVLSRLFWIWRTRGSKNQNLEGTESKFRNLLCILHKPPPHPSFTNKMKARRHLPLMVPDYSPWLPLVRSGLIDWKPKHAFSLLPFVFRISQSSSLRPFVCSGS